MQYTNFGINLGNTNQDYLNNAMSRINKAKESAKKEKKEQFLRLTLSLDEMKYIRKVCHLIPENQSPFDSGGCCSCVYKIAV